VYSVAHPLRLDYVGLQKRLGGVARLRRKASKPAFVELIAPHVATPRECVIEFESLRGGKGAHPVESCRTARLGEPAARLAKCREMIQITAQMRVLVAIEPVDGRKGWQRIYGHPIYFLETFVDPQRFRGTCYRAANWVWLGKTTGRGKQSNSYVPNRSIKEVLGYPLVKQFRELLLGPE
jgi:hypothetical protein